MPEVSQLKTEVTPAQLSLYLEAVPDAVLVDYFSEHITDKHLALFLSQLGRRTGLSTETAKALIDFFSGTISRPTRQLLIDVMLRPDIDWSALESIKPLVDADLGSASFLAAMNSFVTKNNE